MQRSTREDRVFATLTVFLGIKEVQSYTHSVLIVMRSHPRHLRAWSTLDWYLGRSSSDPENMGAKEDILLFSLHILKGA